jgi:transposase, IS30 family
LLPATFEVVQDVSNNTCMKNLEKTAKYGHLSFEERKYLAYLYNREDRGTLRDIGEKMTRAHNTIALEIKVGLIDGVYEPDIGEMKAKLLRSRSKTQSLKLIQDGELRKEVEKDIRERISPRRISGGLKLKGKIVSSKSIYKFIEEYSLESFLCFKGKKREKVPSYNYRKAKELDKVRIKDRPIIEGTYGHYEMDFIVSSVSTSTLLVVVEKKHKTVYVKKIPNRTHKIVLAALREIFKGKLVLSITTDNDIAFSKWKIIEKALGTTIYFCEPYHSWEKGLVENTNRWIRLFVKKKSDIALVTDEKVERILSWFNDYPREIIGFKTSNELELLQLKESCTT